MLSYFTVENFKSINKPVTLDMRALGISENEETLLYGKDEKPYLPLAVLYGPNGSGKSNVLEALAALITLVLRPLQVLEETDEKFNLYQSRMKMEPFAFSKETIKSPTKFEICFLTGEAEYTYFLHVQDKTIVYEELSRKKHPLILHIANANKVDSNEISVEESVLNYNNESIEIPRPRKRFGRYSRLFQREFSDIRMSGELKSIKPVDLTETLPLLSYLAFLHGKNEIIEDIISSLSETYYIHYGDLESDAKINFPTSEDMKQQILGIFYELDIDIKDFRVEEQEKSLKIYTSHIVNEQEFELKLEDESSGSLKLFSILPPLIKILQNGGLLIVDELDAKMHPKLLQYIISLFNDRNRNKKNSQLIFTSHELSTMSRENFRRDEIWFTAKEKDQSTFLYSLADFKTKSGKSPRKDEIYSKRYLEGQYGADPYLKNTIDWTKI